MAENQDFVRIIANTLVFDLGAWLVGPLYIIYFVRELGASDGWIGLNSTLANIGVIAGYALWRRWIRKLGYSRTLLITVPLAASYAFLVSLFPNLTAILIWGILINLVNPGVNLSHFNILLKLCPDDRRASYIAFYATMLNVGAFVGPMIGVALSDWMGIRLVLVLGGVIRLAGRCCFISFRSRYKRVTLAERRHSGPEQGESDKMVEVIAAGHICVDLIPQFTTDAGADLSAYLAPGRLSEVGPMPLATGGSVSNTGLNLKRLGVDTRLMGKVSDDLLGRAILEIVRSYGPELAEAMIVVPGETSSYTMVINPPHIDRIFLHCPGANHTFGADDVRYDLVAQARVFHFGYPPYLGRMYADGGSEMIEMFRRAQETGVTTSLDMAMPDPAGPSGTVDWQAIMRRAMPYVDLFMPSAEEWLFMVNRQRFDELTASVGPAGMLDALQVEDIRALGGEALDMGAKVVVLKLGERGIYMRTARRIDDLGRGGPI